MILILTFATEQERDKFEHLYHKYKNLCLKKAHDILRDWQRAEDAVSEAYLRVYKNLDKIADPDANSAAAFLVTITRNTALTILSREKNTRDALDLDGEEDIADTYDLEASVLSELSESRIYALMGMLGDELRDIFVLKFAYDMPHKEIAETMGLSENNVTVKLHRAKKKLAEALVKEGFAHG